MSNDIVAKHIALLHHTLGLTPEHRNPFRNHFMAGAGHHDQAELLELEAAGLMAQGRTPSFCDDGDMLFMCTEAGKALALDNLPPPPKYSRYQEYRRSEVFESFAEWLGIDVPRRDYHWREQGHFRLKSSRATGEYCATLKEAKATYKAALAARKAEAKVWQEVRP